MLHDAVTTYRTPIGMDRNGSGLFRKIFSYTSSNGALKHLKILYESLLLNPDDVKKNIASLNSTYKSGIILMILLLLRTNSIN